MDHTSCFCMDLTWAYTLLARSQFWLPLDVKDGGLTQTWVLLALTTIIWLGYEGLINFNIHSMMTINERQIPLLSQSVLAGSDSWPGLRFSTSSLIFHWYSSYKVSLVWGIFIHLRCSVGCSTTLLVPTPESSSGQPFGHAWLSSLRGPAWKQANPPIRRWNRSLKVTKTLERSFWTSNIQFGAVVHWDLNSTTQYDVAWHSTC